VYLAVLKKTASKKTIEHIKDYLNHRNEKFLERKEQMRARFEQGAGKTLYRFDMRL